MRTEEVKSVGASAGIQVAVVAVHAVAQVVPHSAFGPQVTGRVDKELAAIANHISKLIVWNGGGVWWGVREGVFRYRLVIWDFSWTAGNGKYYCQHT